ncbi:Aldo/keto reductase [Coniochaeta ligniaria NRRL 30616]|uniref:Aldo/keto reductase n=1 Tax=Coniochaeta ligniaria NRRL 30616 TaxID=1408157 RepID=A0A1J7IX06_9PEZI|nr:Aldo/keto reductase [Coniochaeta ligniaria NRRL 30616]
MSRNHPELIIGSGTIGLAQGDFSTAESVAQLVDTLRAVGINRIDVSSRHPPGSDFLAEKLFGAAGVADKGFAVDVKSHIVQLDPRGSMRREGVRGSVEGSLGRLGLKKANVFWCYAPDEATPVEEQAAAVDEMYREGAFEKFGVSNFPPDLVEKWVAVSEEKGYVKPTAYQGIYNLISRDAETALLPLLRRHGMAFNAYSPLAAGFLTGKATAGQVEGTRFDAAHPLSGYIRAKYDKPVYHEAIGRLLAVLRPEDISPTEAALRWICYHSALGEKDGVILGASRLEQVKQNAEHVKKGPLPEAVVKEIEEVWKALAQ